MRKVGLLGIAVVGSLILGACGTNSSDGGYSSSESTVEKTIETETVESSSQETATSISLLDPEVVEETTNTTEEPSATSETSETEISTDDLNTPISSEFENALQAANDYLAYTAFSKLGLYDQLSYEKYPSEAAQYAIDNVQADWNENALQSANDYLDYTAFSKLGLYDQLIHEKYTPEEAQYAIDNVQADWNENALQAAKDYLDYSAFSQQGLYDQLIYEKYTPEEAQYAIDNVPN